MTMRPDETALIALVDDDPHSARMLMRTLAAEGLGLMRHYASATEAHGILAQARSGEPVLVIVDLKSSSTATSDFVARFRELPGGRAPMVLALAPSLARDVRQGLINAGADAVFERRADLESYRREASLIAGFWRWRAPLELVGT